MISRSSLFQKYLTLPQLFTHRERKSDVSASERPLVEMETLVNNLPMLVSYIDSELIYRFVNHTYFDWFGIRPEQIVGRRAGDIVGKKAFDEVREFMNQALAGQRVSYDREIIFPDESRKFVHANYIPDFAPNGKVRGFYATVVDMTKENLARERLSRAESKVSHLMETNLVGIIFWKLSGEVTSANEAFLEMIGYSSEDLARGRIDWQKLTPPEWKEADERAVKELNQNRFHHPYEKEYFHKDGHRIPILVGTAFTDGSDDSGVSFVLDISEQKEIREKLAASEERFRKIAESLPQLVWTADPKGQVDYYNDRIAHYGGAKNVNGRWEWQMMVHPDDVEKTMQMWNRSVQMKTNYECEHRIQMADGTYRWHLSRGTPLMSENGELQKWFGVAADIDDQIRAKSELQKAKEEAERANQLKSAFLANMSHEIRTPLGAILGFASLLKDMDVSNEEKSQYVDIIVRNGEQLSSLINDILDLSKIEAGHLSLEYSDVAPQTIIEDVVSLLSVKAKEKNLRFTYEAEQSTPRGFVTDAMRFRQILLNIVGNALKFTQHGSVSLRSYSKTENGSEAILFVEVKDTGIGIPENGKEGIFDAFVQADGTYSRKFGGTGLGLALSRQLAKSLGGNVEILKSRVSVGTTFLITIRDQNCSKVSKEVNNLPV